MITLLLLTMCVASSDFRRGFAEQKCGPTSQDLDKERDETEHADGDGVFVRAPRGAQIPSKVDLSQDARMPPVYNQGDIGSCTANALAGAYQFSHATKWCPSRLMLYYGERQIDENIQEDVGSRLEEGVTVMKDCGVVPEQLWPYLANPNDPNETPAFMRDPSCAVWKAAQHHKIQQAFKVEPNEESVKWVLSQGSPIAFAMLVYSSCWSQAMRENGNLPNLEDGDQIVGGHAILLVGYDESTGRFKFRNSWGEEFGDKGYGTITPENFFACLNDNLWVIDPSPKVAAAAQQTNL